jgi:excisionase family DNA binding protein
MLPVLLRSTVGTGPRVTPVQTTDRLLTVHEVAGIMRVSNMTVYRLIRAGELRAARVGRGYRIRESEVDAYLDRGVGIDHEVPD